MSEFLELYTVLEMVSKKGSDPITYHILAKKAYVTYFHSGVVRTRKGHSVKANDMLESNQSASWLFCITTQFPEVDFIFRSFTRV
eukprot:1020773-Ditylum_brightwellii.AAC.1